MANYSYKIFLYALPVSHSTSVTDKRSDRQRMTTHANSSTFAKVRLAKNQMTLTNASKQQIVHKMIHK